MRHAPEGAARRAFAIERNNALADILGQVADPFEVVSDSQNSDDLTQVNRHRLARCDRFNRLLLDLPLLRIELDIRNDYVMGMVRASSRL
jgi:hypothetical protein